MLLLSLTSENLPLLQMEMDNLYYMLAVGGLLLFLYKFFKYTFRQYLPYLHVPLLTWNISLAAVAWGGVDGTH